MTTKTTSIGYKRELMWRNPNYFEILQNSKDKYNAYLGIVAKYEAKVKDAKTKYYDLYLQQDKELDDLFKNA